MPIEVIKGAESRWYLRVGGDLVCEDGFLKTERGGGGGDMLGGESMLLKPPWMGLL